MNPSEAAYKPDFAHWFCQEKLVKMVVRSLWEEIKNVQLK